MSAFLAIVFFCVNEAISHNIIFVQYLEKTKKTLWINSVGNSIAYFYDHEHAFRGAEGSLQSYTEKWSGTL